MKTLVISYYDKKLGVYSNPAVIQYAANEDIIEQTRRMCANPELPVVYFDYDLYILGSFDDRTGAFDTLPKPEFIVSLGDFRYLREQVKENVKES